MTSRSSRSPLHPVLSLPLVLALPLLLLFTACDDDPVGTGEPEVVEIEVTPATATFNAAGATEQLDAVALDDQGEPVTGVSFTWSSDDETVATVSTTGLVTAEGEGETGITARADDVSGTATVIVEVEAAAVDVTPATAAIVVGGTTSFEAEATDANENVIEDAEVTWTSSDETVATVDESGTATGQGQGSATITASVGDVSDMATVTVALEVAAVEVAPGSAEVAVDETVEFSASAEDAEGNEISGLSFTWASDDEAVATVDENGVATGVAEGDATISATADGVSGSAELTVAAAPTAPTLSLVSGDAQNGTTEQDFDEDLVVRIADAEGDPVGGRTVTWSVIGGDANLSEATTTTDEQGETSVTVTAGTGTGEVQIQAAADDTEGGPIAFDLDVSVLRVEIGDNYFEDPQGRRNASFEVNVEVGDTIEWRYVESGLVTHTATSTTEPGGGSSFDSGILNPGDTFRFAPQVEGTWIFFCEIHPSIMVDATINVADPEASQSRSDRLSVPEPAG